MQPPKKKQPHQYKIPLAWVQAADGKMNIDEVLKGNPFLIETLLKIIDQLENEEARQELTQSDYESPSWSHKQADRNGARRAYAKLRGLFSYLKETA